jgi:hypothetical protein
MVMKWEASVYELHERLKTNPGNVSDDEVRRVMENINRRLQTNCDSAAQFLFFFISPVCASKPHLVEESLHKAMFPLFLVGIDTPAQIIDWLRYFLVKCDPYAKLTPEGQMWIEQFLMRNIDLVQDVLKRIGWEEESKQEDTT